VPASIAFGGPIRDLFLGDPASPIVQRAFSQHNEMRRLMSKWLKEHAGKAELPPRVDPARAYGVLAVRTPDGPIYLWAVPADGRQCWFIAFASDLKHRKRATGGGSCDPATPPPTGISWAYGWSRAHPRLEVLSGRVYLDASAVIAHFRDRKPARLTVTDGYFMGTFPRETKLPTRIDALDSRGRVVATTRR
jgi:hypothetical protein